MNENLPIDPSQLDEEWLQQPLLFDLAQQEAADLQEQVDDFKNEIAELNLSLEKVLADRASYVRAAYGKEGFSKPPAQQVVDDWVTKRPEIEVLKEEILQNQVKMSKSINLLLRANNWVKTLQVRKDSLENLCKLHGMNYFSVPNPGHLIDGGKRMLENQKQRVEEKSAEALTKLNEKKKCRSKCGKSKEEVLDSIKNPETKEAARVAIEKDEEKLEQEQKTPVQRIRRQRRGN
jgi:hypothetical protein